MSAEEMAERFYQSRLRLGYRMQPPELHNGVWIVKWQFPEEQ